MIDREFLHDIVNLLAIIKGMTEKSAEMINKDPIEQEKIKHKLSRTLDGIQRLETLVNNKRFELKNANKSESKMSKKILIVDDEQDIREIIKDGLAQINLTAIDVGSGNEAIRLLQNEKIDLIITDCNMPNGSGAEIIHFIKTQELPTKVLLMGGDSVEELKGHMYDELISKPFTITKMIETVKRLISS